MPVYAKGFDTKRKFITLTYNKLTEHNASTITVRDLASDNGCSAPALYRHFESLEYLIAVTSIKFMDDYMKEYGKLLDEEPDLVAAYIKGWELFNKYAFSRPDIFYRLVWGQYKRDFTAAVNEYFELFPFSGSEKYPAYFYTMLFEDDIEVRDFVMLKRAANKKMLSEEDAVFISKTSNLIVAGLLTRSMDADDEERSRLRDECNWLLKENLKRIYKNESFDLARSTNLLSWIEPDFKNLDK